MAWLVEDHAIFSTSGADPETLKTLLHDNINYHGIDIAIQNPKPNLIELDIVKNEITFPGRLFDIIVSAGVFEYVGDMEKQKFGEIRKLLKPGGRFIVSYMNMDHRTKPRYPTWNNIKSIGEFKRNLEAYFHVERCFPSYYSFHDDDLKSKAMRRLQMSLNMDIPVISRLLGVNFIFIAAGRDEDEKKGRRG